MEEADVLCNRIGIMAHGKLQCLGTQLHLKKKFGKGFKLSVSSKKFENSEIQNFLSNLLPTAVLKSNFAGTLEYEVPRKDIQLHQLFEQIENAKREYGIF